MPADAGDQIGRSGPVTVPAPHAAAVLVARDHGSSVAAAVRAVGEVPGVDLVVVVDDGSHDDTLARARDANAVVVTHARPLGPAAAYQTGATAVAGFELGEARAVPHHLLFLDASLGESAKEAGALAAPVFDRRADLAISEVRPAKELASLARFAGQGIARATGWRPRAPLSRQCCVTRAAFEAARPLARGQGLPIGLLIDVHRHGYQVLEVPVELPSESAAGAGESTKRVGPRPWAEVVTALARRGVVPPARAWRTSSDEPD